MPRMRREFIVLAGFISLLVAAPARAADASSTSAGRSAGATLWAVKEEELGAKFSDLAGSEANAKALITGLRNGTSITLTSPSPGGTSTTFTPATRKMGYGDVNIALSLAHAELAAQGITNPTPQQLEAAMNGGSITTSNGTMTLPGILQLRAENKGWGEIAGSRGFKLGEVMRAPKAEKTGAGAQGQREAAKAERAAKEGIADRAPSERGLRPKRVEEPGKPERPERVERPERPEQLEHPTQPSM